MITIEISRPATYPRLDNVTAQSLCTIIGKALPDGVSVRYTIIASNGRYVLALLPDGADFFLHAPGVDESRWPEIFGVALVERRIYPVNELGV